MFLWNFAQNSRLRKFRHGVSIVDCVVNKTRRRSRLWIAPMTVKRVVAGQIAAATLSDNSLRQTVHTHRASLHQAATLVAALLMVARVTAGLAESNGSLPPGL